MLPDAHSLLEGKEKNKNFVFFSAGPNFLLKTSQIENVNSMKMTFSPNKNINVWFFQKKCQNDIILFELLLCNEISFEHTQIATCRSFSTAKAINPTMKKEAVLDSELVVQQYQLQINVHYKTGTLLLLFQGMMWVLEK